MFLARISTYFKLNPQKFSPAAAKIWSENFYRKIFLKKLISEFSTLTKLNPYPPPGEGGGSRTNSEIRVENSEISENMKKKIPEKNFRHDFAAAGENF